MRYYIRLQFFQKNMTAINGSIMKCLKVKKSVSKMEEKKSEILKFRLNELNPQKM